MKITFGMIVFNAELTLPNGMLKACIENIYDVAHEIIIVEGATKAITHYFDGDTTEFTQDGRSTDKTIEILHSINDPLNKIKIIPSKGFWNGKTEMCNAWAKIATGDYIWQLDSDEFYHKEDIIKLINYLKINKKDAVYFNAYHFFGGFDYCIDERSLPDTWGTGPWYRLFRNIPNKSHWISHEHPIYCCDGIICNNNIVMSSSETTKLGIKMYHYGYVSYSQVEFKTKFYKNDLYYKEWNNFLKDKTYKVLGSSAFKFEGEHPEIIKKIYNL